ncbi:McrC family protein [Chryseobacterium angstadtii]|uniref:McrC family protein n=1 Tax=Chryseobacterium angstadtii TaxID=558151 RepID=UPI00065ABB8A|nr:hypothetical protein [Chryseobacterium angstadtii]
MSNNIIYVFEHEKLKVNEEGFNQSHFNALVKFNDTHGGKYFTVGFNHIKFKSYVGVIQVGGKVIEILPKADRKPSSDEQTVLKWKKALLTILKRTGYIQLNETERVSQSAARGSLLDSYIYAFLNEVERLIHLGMVKKYRQNISNSKVLKGRLLIHKQIQINTVHKERFFTEHTVYDRDNTYNGILKKALEVIKYITSNSSINQKVKQNLLYFDNISTWNGASSEIKSLKFDRKTEEYKYAITLADLIIQNFCPDFSSGNHHIMAILFDMNRLFEVYIYKCLKKYENHFSQQKLSISKQNRKIFWQHKSIKPDIVLKYQKEDNSSRSLIIDTKWKIVSNREPSDHDLKQMYVYNFQFNALKSILFYPQIDQLNKGVQKYESSEFVKGMAHGCELYFANLFDENDQLSDHFVLSFLERNLVEQVGDIKETD